MTAPAAGAHTPTITRDLEQQLRETLAVLPRQGHPLGPREERRYRLERGLEAIRLCEAVGERLPVAMEVAVRATLDAAREEQRHVSSRRSDPPLKNDEARRQRLTECGVGADNGAKLAPSGARVPAKYLVVSWRVGGRGFGREHVVETVSSTRSACGAKVGGYADLRFTTLDAPRLCASCVAVTRRAR